jgi:hypothetical protein
MLKGVPRWLGQVYDLDIPRAGCGFADPDRSGSSEAKLRAPPRADITSSCKGEPAF